MTGTEVSLNSYSQGKLAVGSVSVDQVIRNSFLLNDIWEKEGRKMTEKTLRRIAFWMFVIFVPVALFGGLLKASGARGGLSSIILVIGLIGDFCGTYYPLISVCPETIIFLSFRQFSCQNLLREGNGFPPTNCGNDNRTDTN